MTQTGGDYGGGTIYRINLDGSGFKVLHSFVPATEGAAPVAGLVAESGVGSEQILYGTTTTGGPGGGGTVFKFDIRPPLLSVKPVQFLVINNQILVFTNIVAYTNTMGQINVFYVTNYTRITNHIGVVSSSVAATWRQDDGMTHDLVRSSSLNQSLDQWLPQPPNWTNSMDPNEVGWLLKPNPGDPPAFFRLRSVDP